MTGRQSLDCLGIFVENDDEDANEDFLLKRISRTFLLMAPRKQAREHNQ